MSSLPLIHFHQQGPAIFPTRPNPNPPMLKLEPGVYLVQADIKLGFFLTAQAEFELPAKLYGEAPEQAARIAHSFQARPGNTGVLFEGMKGSGKTLLLKTLGSHFIHTLKAPVLMVTAPYCGSGFFEFLQDIQQDCMVVLDEFEKVYDNKQQESMLTLLDGVFMGSKKLFVLTCNETRRIDENMKNRPGRIYYRLTFGGLSRRFVDEYLADKLADKKWLEKTQAAATLFGDHLSFDVLQALVAEVNLYDQAPSECLKYLNARPNEFSYTKLYKVDILNEEGTSVGGDRLSLRIDMNDSFRESIQIPKEAADELRVTPARVPKRAANLMNELDQALNNDWPDELEPAEVAEEPVQKARTGRPQTTSVMVNSENLIKSDVRAGVYEYSLLPNFSGKAVLQEHFEKGSLSGWDNYSRLC